MNAEPFVKAAEEYEELAVQLERAAQHARTAAAHMAQREVPRACAHALAAFGHLSSARATLEELAINHAARATPVLPVD